MKFGMLCILQASLTFGLLSCTKLSTVQVLPPGKKIETNNSNNAIAVTPTPTPVARTTEMPAPSPSPTGSPVPDPVVDEETDIPAYDPKKITPVYLYFPKLYDTQKYGKITGTAKSLVHEGVSFKFEAPYEAETQSFLDIPRSDWLIDFTVLLDDQYFTGSIYLDMLSFERKFHTIFVKPDELGTKTLTTLTDPEAKPACKTGIGGKGWYQNEMILKQTNCSDIANELVSCNTTSDEWSGWFDNNLRFETTNFLISSQCRASFKASLTEEEFSENKEAELKVTKLPSAESAFTRDSMKIPSSAKIGYNFGRFLWEFGWSRNTVTSDFFSNGHDLKDKQGRYYHIIPYAMPSVTTPAPSPAPYDVNSWLPTRYSGIAVAASTNGHEWTNYKILDHDAPSFKEIHDYREPTYGSCYVDNYGTTFCNCKHTIHYVTTTSTSYEGPFMADAPFYLKVERTAQRNTDWFANWDSACSARASAAENVSFAAYPKDTLTYSGTVKVSRVDLDATGFRETVLETKTFKGKDSQDNPDHVVPFVQITQVGQKLLFSRYENGSFQIYQQSVNAGELPTSVGESITLLKTTDSVSAIFSYQKFPQVLFESDGNFYFLNKNKIFRWNGYSKAHAPKISTGMYGLGFQTEHIGTLNSDFSFNTTQFPSAECPSASCNGASYSGYRYLTTTATDSEKDVHIGMHGLGNGHYIYLPFEFLKKATPPNRKAILLYKNSCTKACLAAREFLKDRVAVEENPETLPDDVMAVAGLWQYTATQSKNAYLFSFDGTDWTTTIIGRDFDRLSVAKALRLPFGMVLKKEIGTSGNLSNLTISKSHLNFSLNTHDKPEFSFIDESGYFKTLVVAASETINSGFGGGVAKTSDLPTEDGFAGNTKVRVFSSEVSDNTCGNVMAVAYGTTAPGIGSAEEASGVVSSRDSRAGCARFKWADDAFRANNRDRDQNKIGSCHAFSAVGLVEAAMFREYFQPQSGPRLSEAQLFAENTFLKTEHFVSDFMVISIMNYNWYKKFQPTKMPDGLKKLFVAYEGNSIIFDIDYIKKNGIGFRSDSQYENFANKYIYYRDHNFKMAFNSLVDSLRNQLNYRNPSQDKETVKTALQNFIDGYTTSGDADRVRSALLGGIRAYTKLQTQAKVVSKATLPFERRSSLFSQSIKRHKENYKKPNDAVFQDFCKRKANADGIVPLILSELDANRPVSIGILLDDEMLPNGTAKQLARLRKEHGFHAIMIIGYRKNSTDKEYLFAIRNSWGGAGKGMSYLIPESAMCRIFEVHTLVTHRDLNEANPNRESIADELISVF